MTGPSEVDPAVLAGEPDSVHSFERGDDDLPLAVQPSGSPEWAAADALLEGSPTQLGEEPPAPSS